MKNVLALFDFDGTIIRSDSLIDLCKYHVGKIRFAIGLLRLTPKLVAWKVKLISPQKAKEAFLSQFFYDMSEEEFKKIARSFTSNRLINLLRPEAVKKLELHQTLGHRVIVVSASADWLIYWCQLNQVELINSKMDFSDGKFSGKLIGANCNGMEKRNQVLNSIDLEPYQEIHVYGDSKGDAMLFSLGTHTYYRKFW